MVAVSSVSAGMRSRLRWCLLILPLFAIGQFRGIKSLLARRFGSSSSLLADTTSSSSPAAFTEIRTSSGSYSPSAGYTQFDEKCYLLTNDEYRRRLVEINEEEEEEEDEHHHYHDTMEQQQHRDLRKVKTDTEYLGPCRFDYPKRVPPPTKGYKAAIDFFHFRKDHSQRIACYQFCLKELEAARDYSKISTELLIQAARMGLAPVAAQLVARHGLDPLACAVGGSSESLQCINAVQEAIRGGHADVLQVLSKEIGGLDVPIDPQGRSIRDYILLNGSPIRPADAKSFFDINVSTTKSSSKQQRAKRLAVDSLGDQGWNNKTSYPVDVNRCDIDVLYDGEMTRERFYNDYYVPGRPFVLRGVVPMDEIQTFSKARWATTSRFHPTKVRVKVGPTAYPSLTDQRRCFKEFTITDIENATECPDLPGIPMVHARHPKQDDKDELYPLYDGDLYDERGGWRVIADWFEHPNKDPFHPSRLVWQVFFGGDGSGATLHWHRAAMNILYVGIKEWHVTPPRYRGNTGMPARSAMQMVERDYSRYSMQCTQRPGDLIFIPDYWGHLTVNHGFSIGSAVIYPPNFQLKASAKAKPGSRPKQSEKWKQNDQPTATTKKYEVPRPKAGTQDSSKPMTDVQVKDQPQKQNQKIFFVHINKTGGTSMIRMLSKSCKNQYVSGRWGNGHRTFHATAQSLIEHYHRDTWDGAYTFALVRHPLARQVSNFFFLLDRCSQRHREFCDARLIPTQYNVASMTDEQKIAAFHEYIRKLYQAYPPGSPDHYLFGSRSHGNDGVKSFNATQTSWMVDEHDQIVVQNIFHLETLSQDMHKVVDAVPCLGSYGQRGENDEDTRRKTLEMLHVNPSPSYPDYKLFGKNQRTNRIIQEVYAVDFRNFGYTLE